MTKRRNSEKTKAFRLAILATYAALALELAVTAAPALSDDDYQENALFNPSEQLLLAEKNGKVMIYDGLENDTIDRALNEQYGRIEHMMFVRTQYPTKEEYYEAMDYGCDD